MKIKMHLNFDGRAAEAIEFYQTVGAEVTLLTRYGDMPDVGGPPGMPKPPPQAIMHATLKLGGAEFYLADGAAGGNPQFKGFSMVLQPPTAAEVDRLFAGLSEGGKVGMPLAKTFFSERYGIVTDRFGITWMVMLYGG